MPVVLAVAEGWVTLGVGELVSVAVVLAEAEPAHRGYSATVTGQVHVARLPLTTASLEDTGMVASVAPPAPMSTTLHPLMSAMLSSSARPAFTAPLSHTSLPVAPTVMPTLAMPVGAGRVTVSQGAVLQEQEAQPP